MMYYDYYGLLLITFKVLYALNLLALGVSDQFALWLKDIRK